LAHHPSHGSTPMFNEAPLHTALRALVLEHLLLPARESVQNARAGQDSLLPWLTKTALAEPIKNCNAVFKVSTNEEDKDALAAHKAACGVMLCDTPRCPCCRGSWKISRKSSRSATTPRRACRTCCEKPLAALLPGAAWVRSVNTNCICACCSSAGGGRSSRSELFYTQWCISK
jgi:hypothetical protein